MKTATRYLTFLAAGLCLAVSLSIESEFYSRFLASILGEGRFLWLPILAAVTVQVARLATSWNSASFASRDLVSQATANLRISGAIAIYETIEVTLFGVAYLQGGTAAAFVLFGSFFVWVSFALEIILVRSLNPRAIPSETTKGTPEETPQGMTETAQGTIQGTPRSVPSYGGKTLRRAPRERSANEAGPSNQTTKRDLEAAILAEKDRRERNGEPVSMQRIADAVQCSKTTVYRLLSQN